MSETPVISVISVTVEIKIQKNLFWLSASPDGLIVDSIEGPGLIEIKCPSSKRNLTLSEMLLDRNFSDKQ